MVIGIPGKSFAGALYLNAWGAVAGVVNYQDGALVKDFLTVADKVNTTIAASCGGTVSNNSNSACTNALNNLSNDPSVTKYFTVDTTNPSNPTVVSNFNNGNSNISMQSSMEVCGVGIVEGRLIITSIRHR